MKKWSEPLPGLVRCAVLLVAFAAFSPVFGQEAAAPATHATPAIDPAALSSMHIGIDTVWVLVTAMLVFWMDAGLTNMAAATASLSALITAWLILKKPDASMVLNGCLAGLVAITAPCAFVTITSRAIIGLISGVLAVLAVFLFDKLRLDDPVGALAVHLCNGIFGTLALGMFYNTEIAKSVAGLDTGLTPLAQTIQQLKGVVLVGLVVFPLSLLVWYLLKATIGIRVSAEEELEGLDVGELGNEAYPDFSIVHKQSTFACQPAHSGLTGANQT